MSAVLRILRMTEATGGSEMSTIGVVRDLAGFFLWAGIAGAGIALICAIIVGVALAIGNAGLAGGTGAVWIGGALLSLGAGFSGQWIPALVAVGALIAALVLGPVVRSALTAFVRRHPAPPEKPIITNAPPPVPSHVPAKPVPRAVGVHTVTSESIR